MATAASARRFAINAEVQSGLKIYMEMMFENGGYQNEKEPQRESSGRKLQSLSSSALPSLAP